MNARDHERFVARRRQFRDAFGTYFAALGPISLFDDMRGNVGDQLIWAGTSDLCDDLGLDVQRVSRDQFDHDDRASLVIPGSGAFHRWWHEWLPEVVIGASKAYQRVIIMPSSYDLDVPIVYEALSRENVFCFARDARSFRAVASFSRAALAPDTAIFSRAFTHLVRADRVDRAFARTLISLRTDAGSLELAHGASIVGPNNDISLTSSSLAAFLESIDAAHEVVTDRLHVALASVLRGKYVYYLDPYDRKISDCCAVAFRGAFDSSLQRVDDQWLANQGLTTRRETA